LTDGLCLYCGHRFWNSYLAACSLRSVRVHDFCYPQIVTKTESSAHGRSRPFDNFGGQPDMLGPTLARSVPMADAILVLRHVDRTKTRGCKGLGDCSLGVIFDYGELGPILDLHFDFPRRNVIGLHRRDFDGNGRRPAPNVEATHSRVRIRPRCNGEVSSVNDGDNALRAPRSSLCVVRLVSAGTYD
jgi:hypothetical protein